ncbi:e56f0870-dfc7-4306-999f-593f7f8c3289 [Thermothielavioides terrestris]|uniref:TRIP4/RQT4 C2HC5-type zinc finger domain-containing protein n=2 Tax=Thermothielavioides terrestris TaxID=2587410 RepID=G2R0P5_THETT|nr:uncharacterized protein THITE_2154907 [Thermothielavioides terrestris NRRL 8126]AEO67306.1 hypothetical protein THITE_2154907 [Thermothielavioides terrestris NRRL 8126]SPQ24018.1 e56f0870-dfc7-4306-999f-593f7f8c3289 [Thermothielavioides terrestris]
MSKAQLFQLLPLPDDGLEQVLEYASTLSKAEAAEHFSNMLGDSPQVVEFISAFNARRADPRPAPAAVHSAETSSGQNSEADAVPKPRRAPKKKKPALHTPPPRQVASFESAPGTVYNKKDQQEDYMPGARSGASTPSASNHKANRGKTTAPEPSKPPPSAAAGTLVSELGLPKTKSHSNPVSRTSTPGPSSSRSRAPAATTKVSITGGVPMHGTSTALADLDRAIRALEITTNPTHAANSAAGIAARRCNCVATRHPLLEAAPNCLRCGKVICVKEGLGPCTFCGAPLLSPAEVQGMIRELRAERGRERMALDREAHRRAARGPGPGPGAGAGADDLTVAEAMALQHRDKLLGFQAQNAKRTTVRDEAADFDASAVGSMWASPEERALALKKQQQLLREMEWNAKPEYEKRQQVVSIDLTGKKVFKKTVKVERPPTPEEEDGDGGGGGALPVLGETDAAPKGQPGAFSKNPLLGGLIRPVYDAKGKGAELEGRRDRSTRWRRVQDDLDDNEAVILDGGIYGKGTEAPAATAGDEPACG